MFDQILNSPLLPCKLHFYTLIYYTISRISPLGCLTFIFYQKYCFNKMDLGLFYFRVTIYEFISMLAFVMHYIYCFSILRLVKYLKMKDGYNWPGYMVEMDDASVVSRADITEMQLREGKTRYAPCHRITVVPNCWKTVNQWKSVLVIRI